MKNDPISVLQSAAAALQGPEYQVALCHIADAIAAIRAVGDTDRSTLFAPTSIYDVSGLMSSAEGQHTN